MRINVYSQELTDEVVRVEKVSNTGRPYVAAQLIMHSSPMLHHPPQDDDRSAVTFWLPASPERRESMARAFERVAAIFRDAPAVPPEQEAPLTPDDLPALPPACTDRGFAWVYSAPQTFAYGKACYRAALAASPRPRTEPLVNDSWAGDWLTNRAELHPLTINLVVRFARALASKLAAAEKKYGYSDGWRSDDWLDKCRAHLLEHVAKGDPRDVAAYCAFLWHHGASIASPRPLGPLRATRIDINEPQPSAAPGQVEDTASGDSKEPKP